MQQVEIPGGHALIRDKVNVAGRLVIERTAPAAAAGFRRVKKIRDDQGLPDDLGEKMTLDKVPFTETELEAFQRVQAASIVALVKSWSLDEPVPTTVEDVGEMDPDVYDAIVKVTTPLAFKALKRPDVSIDTGVDDQGRPIVDSPTGPSTD